MKSEAVISKDDYTVYRRTPQTPAAGVRCARCARALAAGEGLPVPKLLRLAAAFSLAGVHMGMWVWHDLALPYCRPCRRWLSFLSVLLPVGVAVGAFFGLRWILSLKP